MCIKKCKIFQTKVKGGWASKQCNRWRGLSCGEKTQIIVSFILLIIIIFCVCKVGTLSSDLKDSQKELKIDMTIESDSCIPKTDTTVLQVKGKIVIEKSDKK